MELSTFLVVLRSGDQPAVVGVALLEVLEDGGRDLRGATAAGRPADLEDGAIADVDGVIAA